MTASVRTLVGLALFPIGVVATHTACQPVCEEGEQPLIVVLVDELDEPVRGATVRVVDFQGEQDCVERVEDERGGIYECLPRASGEVYVVADAFGYNPGESETVSMNSRSCYTASANITLVQRDLDITGEIAPYTVEFMPGSAEDVRLLSFSTWGDSAGLDHTVIAGASYANMTYEGPDGVEYLDLLFTLRDMNGNDVVVDRQCVEPACADTELDIFLDAIEQGLCTTSEDCAADLTLEVTTDRPIVEGERLTVSIAPVVMVMFDATELTDAEPSVEVVAEITATL